MSQSVPDEALSCHSPAAESFPAFLSGLVIGGLVMAVLLVQARPSPAATAVDSSVPTVIGTPREDYRGLPPAEFRGEWSGHIRFVDDVKPICGPDAYACADRRGIIMPNPCTPDNIAQVGWGDGSLAMKRGDYWIEDYRTTLCHELGHAHGWPGTHWIVSETEVAHLRAKMMEDLYERDQINGGMPEAWMLGYNKAPDRDTRAAAIESLVSSGDAYRIRRQGDTSIRLKPCKYWTMREEREGDGAKGIRKWCSTDPPR